MNTLRRIIETDFGRVEVGWNGEPLEGKCLAIDTETSVVDLKRVIPELVVLCASNGTRHVIVHARDVPQFLQAHWDYQWLFFNVAFDFWVLVDVWQRATAGAETPLFEKASSGDMHDGMLLNRLHRLATRGDVSFAGGLEDFARECGVNLSKNAHKNYREGYAALIGRRFDEITDDNWFIYAARDAYATFQAVGGLILKIRDLVTQKHRHLTEGVTLQEYGFLSERIQVMGAIALADVTRKGMALDVNYRDKINARLEQEMLAKAQELNDLLVRNPAFTGALQGTPLFQTDASGAFLRTEETGALRKSRSTLQKMLCAALDQIATDTGRRPRIPSTEKGMGMSIKAEDWDEYSGHHPAIELWMGVDLSIRLTSRRHPRPQSRFPHRGNPALLMIQPWATHLGLRQHQQRRVIHLIDLSE